MDIYRKAFISLSVFIFTASIAATLLLVNLEIEHVRDAHIEPDTHITIVFVILIVTCCCSGLGFMLLYLHSRRSLDRTRHEVSRMETAIGVSNDGIAMTNADGVFTHINKAQLDMYGYRDETEFIGRHWSVLHGEEESRRLDGELVPALRDKGFWQGNATGIRADGQFFELSLSLTKTPTGVIGITRDITAYLASQKHLRLLSSAINRAGDAVFILDRQNKVFYANNAAHTMMGLTGLHALQGESYDMLLHFVQQVRITGQPLSVEQNFQVIDRGEMFLSLSLSPLEEEFVLMILRDVTPSKQNEKDMESLRYQFYQSQKLEALGRMASGMAHDFNNIVSAILLNAEMLCIELQHQKQNVFAQKIRKAAEEAREVISQILIYARKNEVRGSAFPLQQTIRETMGIVQGLVKQGHTLKWRFMEEESHVLGNASQIKQSLVNLCANAVYVLPESEGRLTVQVQKSDVSRHQYPALYNKYKKEPNLMTIAEKPEGRLVATVGSLEEDRDYISLSVQDTGSGMKRDILAHIFEPFFTTKPLHQGTGLGLSAVQGIVLSHKGALIIDTKSGKGTKIQMLLPVTNRQDKEA